MKGFYLILLLHFIADFTLQGCLANLKQKKWWIAECEKYNVDFSKYKYDYICGLICHALYWTLITFAPVIFFTNLSAIRLAIVVVGNMCLHAVIDHIKANKFRINLVEDQFLHLGQIILTVFFC
jgi:hypothetical protein